MEQKLRDIATIPTDGTNFLVWDGSEWLMVFTVDWGDESVDILTWGGDSIKVENAVGWVPLPQSPVGE